MTRHDFIRGHHWIDPGNDPKEPRLLFAKEMVEMLQDGQSVDFSSGKPFAIAEEDPFSTTEGALLVFQTGGSSGKPAQVIHSADNLLHAVAGLQTRIGFGPISSVCCLPLHHLGGWMQVHRAIQTSGSVFFCSCQELAVDTFARKLEGRWLSLVPTQLYKLVKSTQALANLRKARGIFVGGAAISPRLSALCRQEELPVWPTYGMTETAGMVTLLSSEEFLDGREGVGQILPHSELSLGGKDGKIRIKCKSLCLAKPPRRFHPGEWLQTEDYGEFNDEGYWTVSGRGDRLIVSGGENLDPTIAERAIMGTGLVDECVVVGVKDERWGQLARAYLTPSFVNLVEVQKLAKKLLPGANYPREWIVTDKLPLTEMGKPKN